MSIERDLTIIKLRLDAIDAEIESAVQRGMRPGTIDDMKRERDRIQQSLFELQQDPPEVIHANQSSKYGQKGGRKPVPKALLELAQGELDLQRNLDPNALKKTLVTTIAEDLISGALVCPDLPTRYKGEGGFKKLYDHLYSRLAW